VVGGETKSKDLVFDLCWQANERRLQLKVGWRCNEVFSHCEKSNLGQQTDNELGR
jgi:hypothetical protein